MSNERFTKHYIDIINSTLSDTVLRNITMQANAQYVDELVGGLNAENDGLRQQIQEMDTQIKNIINEKNDLNVVKSEYENVKSQAQHAETFRNALVQERNDHEHTKSLVEDLKVQIEKLKEPAIVVKNKKPDNLNKVNKIVLAETTVDAILPEKDGGIF